MDLDGSAFTREFNNLIKLKHPNIVRLVGFCSEDEKVIVECDGKPVTATDMHRALCFEYLQNGSLEKHLYGTILLCITCIFKDERSIFNVHSIFP